MIFCQSFRDNDIRIQELTGNEREWQDFSDERNDSKGTGIMKIENSGDV